MNDEVKTTEAERYRAEWGKLRNLPVTAAATIAGQYGMRQVIIIALNAQDDTTHVVTYGKSEKDCRLAAEAGNNLKRHMGWPEDLCSAVPERLVRTK
jgi:hypothetical protein